MLSRMGVDVGPLSLIKGNCLNRLKNGEHTANACNVCLLSRLDYKTMKSIVKGV